MLILCKLSKYPLFRILLLYILMQTDDVKISKFV